MGNGVLERCFSWLMHRSGTAAQRLGVRASPPVVDIPSPMPPMVALLRTVLAVRDGAVLDIGCAPAFLEACALADRHCRYVGVDPDEPARGDADRFIRTHHLSRHAVLPVTIAAQVTMPAGWGSDLRVARGAHDPAHGTPPGRMAVTGDVLIESLALRPLALIRIDGLGRERSILSGLERTLTGERPVLLFEGLCRGCDALAGLKDRDYLLFRRDPSALVFMQEPGDDPRVVQLGIPAEQVARLLEAWGRMMKTRFVA